MTKLKDEFIVLHNPSRMFHKWELFCKGEQKSVVGETAGDVRIETKMVTRNIGKYSSEERAKGMKMYYESLNKFKGE